MTGAGFLDFRSDTVTRPDAAMRSAMATAEVGDDILDGDPTVRALEEKAAAALGVQAALWVPSGTMGNTIALYTQLRRGDRFLAPALAHVLEGETGAVAALVGGMPHPLPWEGHPGGISPGTVRAEAASTGPYYAVRTTLLCVENTHNAAGGTVLDAGEWAKLTAVAAESGLRVHLDGARIWNAAVALGVGVLELTRGADTVQACLSKGLGAPVGSVVGGSAAFVTEARRVRKMLGGAVRQGGVLAAAGLLALDRVERLQEDHDNARLLASELAALGWDVDEPMTNIVMVRVPDPARAVGRLAEAGVLSVPVGGRLRLMTHQDVTRADVLDAIARIAALPG